MRIRGYCLQCHRFKLVIVKYPAPVGVQMGVCDDCSGKENP